MSPREVESRIAGLGEVPPEDWEATPESVRRLVVTLLEQLERIKKLEQEVADLKEKLGANSGESAEIGNALLFWAAEMFSLWGRFKTAAISRATLRQNMAPIRSMIIEVLELGTACAHSKTANTCREILGLRRALWTFVRVEGVEPTNNAAERTIRPAVMWRKTSFGTDSEAGARFVERILTVTATCRQQGRNPLEFIHHAIIAAFSNRPAPSLLPAT